MNTMNFNLLAGQTAYYQKRVGNDIWNWTISVVNDPETGEHYGMTTGTGDLKDAWNTTYYRNLDDAMLAARMTHRVTVEVLGYDHVGTRFN